MIEIRIVSDGDEMMGIEIREDNNWYFISVRQDYWPGLRIGKFPGRLDRDFEREIVKVFQADSA